MSSDLALSVEGLGKRYRIGTGHQHNSLRDLIAEGSRSLLRRSGNAPRMEDFWALKDASFDVAQGESVGIIGLNGAGKSTLLKLLSRITEPTVGSALIVGRVGALLEVGTGFHMELTGRENLYLYSAILGMQRNEVRRKYDAIVDFAGLKDFMDTPVKRYSSGMYVRLAFAVAAHLEPDILLLDEVLSVGDITFQRKCMDFAKRLQRSDATILFVSHNMFSIKTMCRRVIYLKNGAVVFDGPTDEGIKIYEDDCRSLAPLLWTEENPKNLALAVTELTMADEKGTVKTVFDYGERMRLRVRCKARRPVEQPNFIVAFIRSDGVACCNFSNEADGVHLDWLDGGESTIELVTPPLKLVAELYTVHILVREKGFQKLICAQIGGTFHVRHELFDSNFGVFHESAQWIYNKDNFSSRRRIA